MEPTLHCQSRTTKGTGPDRLAARLLAASVLAAVVLMGGCGDGDGPISNAGDGGDAMAQPGDVSNDSDVPVLTTEDGIEFVRTPDERFEDLPGYPFEPNYVTLNGLRLHYVDEGPADGEVVLLLHGEPSWSYLYRKMIPVLADAGHRVIALDLMGMGRSDKPIDLSVHTYEQQIDWVTRFIETLDLQEITLFCQDWGGLIGLRIVGDHPERFARVVAANTRLPVIPPGFNPFTVPDEIAIDPEKGDFASFLASVDTEQAQPARFQRWIEYSLTAPSLTPSEVVEALTARDLTPGEAAGYDAPYPSLIYKAAIRAFPSMIVAVEDENAPAWATLGEFKKPLLTLFGRLDLNLGSEGVQNLLVDHVPGARGQPHDHFEAHHFIQEDIGELLAERVNAFIANNPAP